MKNSVESGARLPKVYLAGPMRGKFGMNFGNFDIFRDRWRAKGYHVISPADLYRLTIGPPEMERIYTKEQLKSIIFRDMEALAECDLVAVLPGWEMSLGSTLEITLANFLGIPIVSAMTGDSINASTLPYANQIHLKRGAATNAPSLTQRDGSLQGPYPGDTNGDDYNPDHAVT